MTRGRGLAFALWPGVLLCTVAAVMAFTLSFTALRAVGIASGISPRLAWMFPLTIDTVILFGTWAAFRFRALGAAGTWYAWVLLVVFAAASWTGNFLHAEPVPVGHMSLPRPVASLFSSVPSLSLLLTTHMLVLIAVRRGEEVARAVVPDQEEQRTVLDVVDVEADDVPPSAVLTASAVRAAIEASHDDDRAALPVIVEDAATRQRCLRGRARRVPAAPCGPPTGRRPRRLGRLPSARRAPGARDRRRRRRPRELGGHRPPPPGRPSPDRPSSLRRGSMNTDIQTGERIRDLQEQLRGFVHRRLYAGSRAYVVRDEFGDVAAATDDVLGDVAVVLWKGREAWVDLPAEQQRRWAFGVARNLANRRLKAARDLPARKLKVAPVIDGLAEKRTLDPDLLAAVEHLRLAIETQAGAGAWNQVLTAALRTQSPGLRSDLREAIEAARTGAPIDLKRVLRRCRADWHTWATARLEAGETLCPLDAADLGLFPTTTAATSALVTWWAEQRCALGLAVDRAALAAGGIVDHLGASEGAREQAAEDLLVWLRRQVAAAEPAAA